MRVQAQLFLELKQHKRVLRIVRPLLARTRRCSAVSARPLRLATMLFVALGSLESWAEAAVELERAAVEAARLWQGLQSAGAFCIVHAHIRVLLGCELAKLHTSR